MRTWEESEKESGQGRDRDMLCMDAYNNNNGMTYFKRIYLHF